MRTPLLPLLLALLVLPGCAALGELDLDALAEAIAEAQAESERDTTVIDIGDGPPPPPAAAGDPNNPHVPAAVAAASPTAVTPAMLAALQPIAERAQREITTAGTFDSAVESIQSFRPTPAERERVRVLGFKTLTIEIGGGGNSPYLVGASLSQGAAFSLTPGETVYGITAGGFSVGVPGAGGDLRIGLWTAGIDELAGWSLAVSGSGVTPKGVGVGVGVYWTIGAPPQFAGFNVGASFGKPGVGANAGLAWTEYSQQILNTISDVGNVFGRDGTRHGAAIGEACTVGADCAGYKFPVGRPDAGTACCDGTCQMTKKDWAGISWCPAVCKSSIFGAHGTC